MDLKTGVRWCGSTDFINLYQDRGSGGVMNMRVALNVENFMGLTYTWPCIVISFDVNVAVHRNII